MKMQTWLILAAVFVVTDAGAAGSMRCSNRIINEGDHKAKVVELCGNPSYIEQRTVLRAGFPRREIRFGVNDVRSTSDRELLVHDRSLVEVQVDVWVYSLGRNRLMRELVFHDGRIVEVNTLGRGY